MKTVTIIPKSTRARNRVREHGDTFVFRREDNPQFADGRRAVLCKTKSGNWIGWFDEDEAEWKVTDE